MTSSFRSGRRRPGAIKARTTSRLTENDANTREEKEGARGETMGFPELKQDRSLVPSAFEYATAPESQDVVKLEKRYGLFIGDEFVEPHSGESHPSISPA